MAVLCTALRPQRTDRPQRTGGHPKTRHEDEQALHKSVTRHNKICIWPVQRPDSALPSYPVLYTAQAAIRNHTVEGMSR